MTMKRFWKFKTLVTVAMLTVLQACVCDDSMLNVNAEEPPAEHKKISLTEAQRQMRDNNNEFACNLFRTINAQKTGDASTIVSPISVSYVLGMLNDGADGETRQQIADVLGLGNSVEEINLFFKKMIEEAPYVDTQVTVKIANSIDVNSGLGISLIPQYEADMMKYYRAPVYAMDFNENSNLAFINKWCNTNTDGMVPSILDELNPLASMYLLNAVYFKANWTEKYDPKETRNMYFTKQNGTNVERKMMHLKTKADYAKNDLYKMLCLPYGSKGYCMYLLLPNEGKTIDDVIQSLTSQSLDNQRLNTFSAAVDILIPRFTTENETKLENVLSSMGMPLAFDYDLADFPNMAQGYNLYVSMMKQKAKIEVNEEGTKAAAVTVAEMTHKSSSSVSGYTFHATRPFVYFIMEESTGSIFFMGTYCGD